MRREGREATLSTGSPLHTLSMSSKEDRPALMSRPPNQMMRPYTLKRENCVHAYEGEEDIVDMCVGGVAEGGGSVNTGNSVANPLPHLCPLPLPVSSPSLPR